jgi:hypothetical protein
MGVRPSAPVRPVASLSPCSPLPCSSATASTLMLASRSSVPDVACLDPYGAEKRSILARSAFRGGIAVMDRFCDGLHWALAEQQYTV